MRMGGVRSAPHQSSAGKGWENPESAAPASGDRNFLLLVLELVEAVVDAAKARSSWCEPCSRRRPLWNTRMRSACWMVLRRCAMTMAVRPVSRRSSASRISSFGFGVHARGGFIEDQESRIVRQGAGKADQLALADRKRGAAFGDGRFHALRQGFKQRAEAHFAQAPLGDRALDRLRAQADVRFERAGEKEGSCSTMPNCRRSCCTSSSRMSTPSRRIWPRWIS